MKFKSLRNKINNVKKNEAVCYKRQLFSECNGDPRESWNRTKMLMDWKAPGTPYQIIVDNKLFRKAGEVASLMNKFLLKKLVI